MPLDIRDRIVRLERMPADSLVPHPDNWKDHNETQREAMREVLETIGFAGAALVYQRDDGRWGLMDGHLRADEMGDQVIPVLITDLSPQEAERMMVMYDPIAQLAGIDREKADILRERAIRDDAPEVVIRLLDAQTERYRLLTIAAAAVGPDAYDMALLEPPSAATLAAYGLGGLAGGGQGGGDGDVWNGAATGGNGSDLGGATGYAAGGRAGDDLGGDGELGPDNPLGGLETDDDGGSISLADASARAAGLVSRFIVPPFSVLDTRQAYWLERRRAWLALGMESELGRQTSGENARFGKGAAMRTAMAGSNHDFEAGGGVERPMISVFDPVLCELTYRWFSPPGGLVLDPFAGGSVRGLGGAHTQRRYLGIDLRGEQIAANRAQWARIGGPGAPQPMSLAAWMQRLYRVAASPSTFTGDLGYWPEELGHYIEGLCRAHSDEPITFTTLPGLLEPLDAEKPYERDTAVIIFSGGKDSIAAAVLAERRGYHPHCVYVERVNKSFPSEGANAAVIARHLGWGFTSLTPEDLPPIWVESSVKNQYCLALALHALPFTPGAYAFGNYEYEDVVVTVAYHDMYPAYNAFDEAVQAVSRVHLAAGIVRLPALRDDVAAYRIWRELDDDLVFDHTTSCVLPYRFKVQHHARSVEQGIPWTHAYDCGVCEKCCTRALIFAAHFGEQYPPDYLAKCRKNVAGYGTDAATWSHTHPSLITWAGDEDHPGGSMDYYLNYVCGGLVGADSPKPDANEPVWTQLSDVPSAVSDPGAVTPIEVRGAFYAKREDLFQVAGVCGAKARAVWQMSEGAAGLVTSGGVDSAQIGVVAAVARARGIPARIFIPESNKRTESLDRAAAFGAELIGVNPGHTTVLKARARHDAADRPGWCEIPYSLVDAHTPFFTVGQVSNVPLSAETRIVVAVGGGMTLLGIVMGLRTLDVSPTTPSGQKRIVGVLVGSDPSKTLDAMLPEWRDYAELVEAEGEYHDPASETVWQGLELDGFYEAKAAPFARPGDVLWVSGNHTPPVPFGVAVPEWIEGDSADATTWRDVPPESADLIFTCPPYYDLERYSDDARDLSNAPHYADFLEGMRNVLEHCAARLKSDRFAVLVLGDLRDRSGVLRGLVPDVISLAAQCGLAYYNDGIILNSAGSLPIRAGRTFTLGRKLGRIHQSYLVFVKGDPKRAVHACGVIEVTLPDEVRAEAERAAIRERRLGIPADDVTDDETETDDDGAD